MVVQHNLRAMNSNRMLGLTSATQSKSTEKLSSVACCLFEQDAIVIATAAIAVK